jgi:multidrug efflux pump subunit AcrB
LSLEGEQRQSGEYLVSLVFPFLIALFVIYALLAIPLGSYTQPLMIMSVIPFAYVGAIWGHQIMKQFDLIGGVAMMSILGMIAAGGSRSEQQSHFNLHGESASQGGYAIR